MAFGTKGWRKIVVAEQVCYWQPHTTYSNSWDAEPSNRVLQARFERDPNRHLVVNSGQCGAHIVGFNWRVTPRIAQCCIEGAINSGWLGERPKLRMVLFNPPFHYVVTKPSWGTSTVVALAAGIYEEKAFERLPILADALQDAGCDCNAILDHFRDPAAAHVRGCWALDLVLGKE